MSISCAYVAYVNRHTPRMSFAGGRWWSRGDARRWWRRPGPSSFEPRGRRFAAKGYAAASMDDLTAEAGLTRGALYHNFGDKKGLLQAVIDQIDAEMVARLRAVRERAETAWRGFLDEGIAYIEMALSPRSSASCCWTGRPCSAIRRGGPARTRAFAGPRKGSRRSSTRDGQAGGCGGSGAADQRCGAQRLALDCRGRRSSGSVREGGRGVPASRGRSAAERGMTTGGTCRRRRWLSP